MIDRKYFTIVVENELNSFEADFELIHLLNTAYVVIIAEDSDGNYIILKDNSVYLFIHDSHDQYVKLFDDLNSFYSNTVFYDNVELEKRTNDFNKEYRKEYPYEPNKLHDYLILTSKFVEQLGGKRIIPKYKEGSYYNISQAYIDGTLTDDEFRILSHL
jgi:hypothetical protein